MRTTLALLGFDVLELLCMGFVVGFLAATVLAIWIWRRFRKRPPEK